MAAQGASLQSSNNQLVALLEDLKEQKTGLQHSIQKEEEEKNTLQREIAMLTDRLTQLNRTLHSDSISRKSSTRAEYDRAIREMEGAYMKILESSQTLLHVMKREGATLAKKASEAK